MCRLLSSVNILIVVLGLFLPSPCAAARKWDYEPISVDAQSDDETKLKLQLKIDRVSRGVYAISGTLDWNYDVADDTMIEAVAYRSRTGNEDDYSLLPWNVPNQHIYEVMDTYYKDFFMPSFAGCSNIPVFEDQFEPPWPKRLYTFNRCTSDGEGLPEILPEGFYKINLNITGEVNWGVQVIVKLETKLA